MLLIRSVRRSDFTSLQIPCVAFRNVLFFHGEELSALRLPGRPVDHTLLTVRDCFFTVPPVSGEVQQIQLRAEDRENGDLGTVAP